MSMRLEMLQVARLAPAMLGDSASLVLQFVESQANSDGGFKDRNGQSDLYYTLFGLDTLIALKRDHLEPEHDIWARAESYLKSFGPGNQLDFVHLCALARSWAALAGLARRIPEAWRGSILEQIENCRAADGGYHPVRRNSRGTAYAAFLALGAYQDLAGEMPEPLRLVRSLKLLETEDGAWANEPGVKIGSTNATAAAVTLLRNLSMPIHSRVGDWLLARLHSQGGFLAAPNAPIPDLLSTATALHALSGLQMELNPVREPCLDFIDTLWTNEGGFHGNWTDEFLDVEYTFYGLLALGHLSV
jgi:prenyltransferase beta subunit